MNEHAPPNPGLVLNVAVARYELAAHYSTATPVIRLVSGLAGGADLLAAELHRDRASKNVTHELGAVLDFDRLAERSNAFARILNEVRADAENLHKDVAKAKAPGADPGS